MFNFKRIKHLNNFKTPKVEKMNLMFYRCEFLSSLNINGFQVSNKTDLTDMFKEMNKNCIVNVSNNEIKKYIN